MKHFLIIFALMLATLQAEEVASTMVPAHLTHKSIFKNQACTLRIAFDQAIDEPEDLPRLPDRLRLLDIQVRATPDSKEHQSIAIVTFAPTATGLTTFPSLDFQAGEKHYQSEPVQFHVGAPQASKQMSLRIEPSKSRVYVGEPVRFDLTWECSLEAGALEELRLNPSFFTDANIEVAIPRNTAAEERQVGLPIGGRRVIATRDLFADDKKALGKVTLPMYLRFHEAGTVTLNSSRLDIAVLSKPKAMFGHYAAHFNNSFFNATSPEEHYRRVYTIAPEIKIEVLPLPDLAADQQFSGLFHPIQMVHSISHPESSIGQLLEHETKLITPVPRELLSLPSLSEMGDFDERFVIDDNSSKRWAPDHTLFLRRLRVLSTSVSQIPALDLLCFNPTNGKYEPLRTTPIPIQLQASNGQEHLARELFHTSTILTEQPEGIWHNQQTNTMQDLAHTILVFLAENTLSIAILGTLLFLILRPVLVMRRKLRHSPQLRLTHKAFHQFMSQAQGSPEQAKAFFLWLARTQGASPEAWTKADSIKILEKAHASDQEISLVAQVHQELDRAEFSTTPSTPSQLDLKPLAKKLSKVLLKSIPILVLSLGTLGSSLEASEHWVKAEALFAQAQQTNPASKQQFSEAALIFEASAEAGDRVGKSLYNAGNAWFNAGEIGRAIASYRQAQFYLPLDRELSANLATVRSLVDIDSSEPTSSQLLKLPRIYLLALFSIGFTALIIALLSHCYYRHAFTKRLSITLAFIVIATGALNLRAAYLAERSAITIVDHVAAKKGPNHAFANAFQQALSDGVECQILEERDDWTLIQLENKQQAWIPSSQLQRIYQ